MTEYLDSERKVIRLTREPSQEELRKAIEEGRATLVPLDQVFSNPIGRATDLAFDQLLPYVDSDIYEFLDNIAVDLAHRLLSWNASLPSGEQHHPGWILKKAHDEVKARISRSLLARLNVEMGFDADYLP